MDIFSPFRLHNILTIPSSLVHQTCQKSAVSMEEVDLEVDLPEQQYKIRKTIPIPFDPRISNNGRFETLTEAMTFVARHCQFHHQQFNRNLARMYLNKCRVLDFSRGGFVTPTHVTKRDFDAAFHQACKSLSIQ